MKRAIALFSTLFLITPAVTAGPSQKPSYNNIKTVNRSFSPGEKLTYEISWSKIVQAGIAVMEVREAMTRENRPAYELVSSTHSTGLVEKFYPVRDTVKSIVDEDLGSVSFSLRSSRGKRKRERDMLFDRGKGTVRVTANGGSQVYSVPERVQDALSSLYYLRTRSDLIVGKPIVVDVHDSGKTWAVEIQTLGREKITTPAGEFDTVKIITHPRYEGVFMNKGEITIWLTNDARRVPVLMKSTISIGSIVATLTEIEAGKANP
ncbi:MAG TPA: DUF3108 domain-containing protein [Nitrospirota bacterium]|nr:DUF3108 domain-containing protein [Nitrospirota bacterium]